MTFNTADGFDLEDRTHLTRLTQANHKGFSMIKHPLFRIFLFIVAIVLFGILMMPDTTAVSADNGGYLHTDGHLIRNANGEIVRITGVNWFGFETGNNVVHGLWARNWESVLDQIVDLGYNTIRLPFSSEVLEPGKMPDSVEQNLNPDLVGLSSIEIFDQIIAGARARGLKVILDHHRSNAGVSAQENGLWYTDAYSYQDWIADWEWLTQRYLNDDTVVGMDLHNEPHDSACWGCGDPAVDWSMAAAEAGNAILAINPNLLIFVEGVECYNPNGSTDPYVAGTDCTWWGGNLLGVADHPITLNVPNRLVYSPHEYPASVYPQDWFSDPSYPDNLPGVWQHYWGYIHDQNIAPLMFGEFGTRYETQSDITWLNTFVDYMRSKGMNGTYWSLNPNSGDTGGLLEDDWATVRQDKQAVLAPWLGSMLGEVPPTPTPGPGGGSASLKLQYQNGDTATTDAQIRPNIQLVNTGNTAVSLETITIRYWFTDEGGNPVNYFCDYAVIGCSYLSGRFTALTNPVNGADSYMQIQFTGGTLPPHGQSGVIQSRFAKSNWSNFDESDDYSYAAGQTNLADYEAITVYQNGSLIWGIEPVGGGTPIPTPPTLTLTPTPTPPLPTATATPTTTPVGPTPSATPTVTATPETGTGCVVNYDNNNDWGAGFVANVTITNNGSTAINGWTLTFDFSGNQTIVNLWNGNYSQTGQAVSATDSGWNNNIPVNGSVSFGFQATYSGSNPSPTDFKLNGVNCNS